jgi:ribosomal protein S18 acetylase RimI-like enzyme
MESEFRIASTDDLETLISFARTFYAHERIAFDEAKARTAFRLLVEDPQLGRAWVIMADGAPVGYSVVTFGFSIEYGGPDAILDEIYIRESHRHLGLGAQALRLAEDACREYGLHALHLEVEGSNTAAQALYRAHGFVDHDRYFMTKDV